MAATRRKTTPKAPWRNLRGAAAKTGRGKRFLLNEIKAGRLRAALIGGRREVITCDAWLDDWLANQAAVVPLPRRQRTG